MIGLRDGRRKYPAHDLRQRQDTVDNNFKRHTPFHQRHLEAGAHLVDVLGFGVPMSIAGTEEEVRATRTGVGVFDVLYQVVILVSGPDAEALLRAVFVNDVARCRQGRSMYSSLCNEDGGMIDDLIIYRMDERTFWLCPTPTRVEAVVSWLERHGAGMNAFVCNLGYKYAYLSVQGPKSRSTLSKLTDADLSDSALPYFGHVTARLAGIENAVISRTGYSGELGYELFFPSEYGLHVWDTLMAAGAEYGIAPCGIGALRSLRIEKKYPSYGSDIDESTTPVEAGLGWTVRLEGRDFVGAAALRKQIEDGPKRLLVCLKVIGVQQILPGAAVVDAGNEIGKVTSSAVGFWTGATYAMAYVPTPFARQGAELEIVSGTERHTASVYTEAPLDPKRERMKV